MGSGGELRARIAGLDLIRGLAVALVIGSHALPMQMGIAGGFGVVMFFTLSGYLITGVLLSDMQRYGRIRYGRFYRNRALRLLPPLLFLLAAYIPFALTVQSLRSNLLRDLGIAIGYLSDIPGLAMSPFLGHLWSLAVEEQFYLIWPALIAFAFVLHRYWPAFAILGGLIVAVSALAWVLGYPGAGTWPVAILVGAAAQIWLRSFRPGRIGRTVLLACALAGTAVFLLVPSQRPPSNVMYLGIEPAAAVLTVVLILVVREWVELPSRLLRPVQALGIVSYAAYLWNFPLATIGDKLPFGPWPGIVLPVVMAMISWRLIEKPVARWRARLDARTTPRMEMRHDERSSEAIA